MNKEKLLSKRKVLLKHMLCKVDDAKNRVERIKDDRHDKMERYYEKQQEAAQKQMEIQDQKQKAGTLAVQEREASRLHQISEYENNKIRKN